MPAFASSIVETLRLPVLVLDAELRVRRANPAFYRAFRIEAQTDGRPLDEVGDGQWSDPQLQGLLQGVLRGEPFADFQIEMDFRNVGRRVLLLGASGVLHEGAPMILLSVEDVTAGVEAREELERLNRELEDRVRERTAQLEAANHELEAFCYSVSHDLRAPLRAVDGFSDELLSSYPGRALDDRGQHYLRRIKAGAERMGRLIDDLLGLSRLNRGEMRRERVDLSALAESVAAELRQHEPGRQVTVSVEPGLSAWGDAGLLKVALENLLGNAWKFTSKKPSATIAVGRAEREGRAAFFVRDDGAGFDQAHSSGLFRPFQRLHQERDFPGEGVGLATVQRVVHRHGGQVWAEGEPGKGAAFYFSLPEAPCPAVTAGDEEGRLRRPAPIRPSRHD
jgi:signal transduction histidine kinase